MKILFLHGWHSVPGGVNHRTNSVSSLPVLEPTSTRYNRCFD